MTLPVSRLSRKATGLRAIMRLRLRGWSFTQAWPVVRRCGYSQRARAHERFTGQFTVSRYPALDLVDALVPARITVDGKPGHGTNAVLDSAAARH